MNKAFEKILEELEKYKYSHLVERDSEQLMHCKEVGDCSMLDCSLCIFDKAIKIVQQVVEEYNYLSESFDSSLLKRIADYFSSVYEGDDKTAPKMELSVDDLRYIANLHVEKCRLQAEINNIKKSNAEFNNGWIPCSERLPTTEEYQRGNGRFLVTDGNRTYEAEYDIYESHTFVKSQMASNWFVTDNCVTHWQNEPLPETFQSKGSEKHGK